MDDRRAHRPRFWPVAGHLALAWIAAWVLTSVVVWALTAAVGPYIHLEDVPWIFGGEPLGVLAAAPIALVQLGLLTVFTRGTVPRGTGGERPALLPLLAVLAGTSVLAAPFWLDAADRGADGDGAGAGVLMWLLAAGLIRQVPWRVVEAAPRPRHDRRALVGGLVALVTLLAAPVAYATFHPLSLSVGSCGGEACEDEHGRPTGLALYLSNRGRTDLEVLSVTPDGLPPQVRVAAIEHVPPGRVAPTMERLFVRQRFPVVARADADASEDDRAVEARFRFAIRRPCTSGDHSAWRVERVRVRYRLHGRELTDTLALDEPAPVAARCPATRR